MATVYCMGCGRQLDEGAHFCPSCGAPTRLRMELEAQTVQASEAQEAVTTVGAEEFRKRIVLSRRSMAIGGAAAALALVLILVAGFASGLFRGVRLPAVGSDVAADASDATTPPEDANLGTAGIAVRETLADYSWQELSILGKEMTRRGSKNEALTLAHEYHLVDEQGRMTQVTKDLTISGMGTLPMRLADVYHDSLADGEGMAGLTFLSTTATLTHAMKANDDNIGGWEASQMRSWLNSEVLDMLDGELAPLVVAVDKHTNNVGNTTSVDAVTSTLDMLWIPSVVEVCGQVAWYWDSDPGNSEAYNAVLGAEGYQYACFAEMGVNPAQDNPGLVLEGASGATQWWLRSSSASRAAHYRIVDELGNPSRWGEGPSELGVCLGFCL